MAAPLRQGPHPGETTESPGPWEENDNDAPGGYLPIDAGRPDRSVTLTYVALWARAFMLTLSSELCIAPWLLPRTEPRGRRLGAVLAANVLSHPAVWFVFPELGLKYTPMLILAEAWAFGSELLVYQLVFRGLSWRRAIAVSALANAVSLGLGLLLRGLGVAL